ncbi:histidine phosphatase family protein [Hoeflea sp.]|uniref:histidine phosphatase family protein n=1 Tax=Hoeflea sp. TaxID=1940281 RepID=UPI001996E088|nr:histidine phosphatase family protein [Hoeflea sp.]MBC7281878.1 histidine phosphatase family protein [Hoeflea sp.]
MRWIIFIALFWPAAASANDWAALDQPGAVAIMRHALAPGTGDPAGFDLGDCSTQRNLNEAGREQARSIGDAFRARGIVFDHVFTGQWCRTRETAQLLKLGPVTEVPALNSFFGDVSTRDSQTEATRALIAEQPGLVFLVSHQVNISALTGEFTRSGEVLVIRAGPKDIEVLGSILIEPPRP